MKKIVLLGDLSSIWVKAFINEVLSDEDEIYVISNERSNKNIQYDLTTKIQHLNFGCCNVVKKLKLEGGAYIFYVLCQLIKLKRVDILHIQYVNIRKLIAAKLIGSRCDKVIYTFWGSDLYRRTEKEKKLYDYLFRKNALFTVGSEDMYALFQESYLRHKENVFVVRFGVNSLEEIHKLLHTKPQLKEKWGIKPDDVVIVIGYNGAVQQNQIKVLEQLNAAAKLLPSERIYIILPMTYGLTRLYKDEVMEAVECGKFRYTMLMDYMNSEKVAELCIITDVFIHAQPTDALSASVQEQLCAKSLVLNPSWINYQELKKQGVFYWEYNQFEEIPALLESYFSGYFESYNNKLEENCRLIMDFSSWSSIKGQWEEIYIS